MFQSFENDNSSKDVAPRVKALRARLAKMKLDGMIIPREDEFQGEYVPAANERLKWISGFGGSAGRSAGRGSAAGRRWPLFGHGPTRLQPGADSPALHSGGEDARHRPSRLRPGLRLQRPAAAPAAAPATAALCAARLACASGGPSLARAWRRVRGSRRLGVAWRGGGCRRLQAAPADGKKQVMHRLLRSCCPGATRTSHP